MLNTENLYKKQYAIDTINKPTAIAKEETKDGIFVLKRERTLS